MNKWKNTIKAIVFPVEMCILRDILDRYRSLQRAVLKLSLIFRETNFLIIFPIQSISIIVPAVIKYSALVPL